MKKIKRKEFSKSQKRAITFFLSFVASLWVLRSPALYGVSPVLQYIEDAYAYGGFALMMTAVILTAVTIVAGALAATWCIDIFHKGILYAAYLADMKLEKAQKASSKVVYKRKASDEEWDKFLQKFEPIRPTMARIVEKYDHN